MEYTHLGRTGLAVSPLCLGTMNFGQVTEEADSHAIMDAALDKGINFFDSANVYGASGPNGKGATESILGTWFAQGGERREKTVLATKLYGDMPADGQWPNFGKLSALNIRRAHWTPRCSALQTDYIDIYQFHHVDRDTPWEEIWQAIDTAIQQGKILYAGSSNFAGWHLAQAQAAAARAWHGRPRERAVALQPPRARHRARGHPGRAALRHRRHPVVAARLGRARRRDRQGHRRHAPRRPRGVRRGAPRGAHAVGGPLRPARSRTRRGRPRLAHGAAGRDRTDHRSAHHGAARLGDGRPRRATSTTRRSSGSTRSSPATRRPPEDYAW